MFGRLLSRFFPKPPAVPPGPAKPWLTLVFQREGEVLVPRVAVGADDAFDALGWERVGYNINVNEVLDEAGFVVGVVGGFPWDSDASDPLRRRSLEFLAARNAEAWFEGRWLHYLVALDPTADALARMRPRAKLGEALSNSCGEEVLYGGEDSVHALAATWCYEWEDEAAGLLRVSDAPGKMVFARALERWESAAPTRVRPLGP